MLKGYLIPRTGALLVVAISNKFRNKKTRAGSFLGALAKLRKATVNFIMSVRLSVHTEQLRSRRTDFN
jgi:hypothetical protein